MTDSKNSGEDFLTKKNESTTLSGLATKSGMSNSAIKLSYFTGNSDWIIDSSATDHMTCDRYRFSHLSSKSSKITITNANGVSFPVIGIDSDFSSIRATGSDTTNGPDEDNRTIENDTIDQSDDRERLQIDELTTPNTEDNSLHDSTMSPNNPIQPLGQSSLETLLEVPINLNSTIVDDVNFESQLPKYHLPPRSNRGISPIKYEPDPKSKVRYPISDHVSSKKLSKSYASYMLQLSYVSIPSKMQEALADVRWT
ncbi:hypothetical protein LWI29_008945 [Acer saccharum]|uniref:Retrovirus-related Pol polyprotein from transposon TNT 1-94-like beta-barrel domain-containing protein n=1 Tax=Acer saccharum TaxID=4024 RepID=A0AA39VX79_ACESA|nr:hypothetical protein LWI29_008945 [Acer saccharum]